MPDRKDDVLHMLRVKEHELKEHEGEIRADAAKRSRAALLGSLMEQVGPLLSRNTLWHQLFSCNRIVKI
jgi:predicted Holliday junction resolvase-like endonuclease